MTVYLRKVGNDCNKFCYDVNNNACYFKNKDKCADIKIKKCLGKVYIQITEQEYENAKKNREQKKS